MLRTRQAMMLAGLTMFQAVGCATLQFPWGDEKFAKATPQNPVVQIVCLWEQAEGRDPEGVPCRGFAGQILFLANRGAAPVEVDGEVSIYLFDNVGTTEEQAAPYHEFDFDSVAWRQHLSKSAVGPSYSVFVPYTRRGQQNAQCALRVRLVPKNGPKIFSESAAIALRGPGSTSETTIISEAKSPHDGLQAEVNAALSRAMQKTTTIPLKKTESGNLAMANPAPPSPGQPVAADSANDRLSRMEQLLADILAQKATAQPSPMNPSAVVPAHYETASPREDSDSAPLRFKLNRSESASPDFAQ